MADKPERRKLQWREVEENEARNDFAKLGTNAEAYLERIITDDVFSTDPYSNAFNLGYQALAREILGYTRSPGRQTQVIKNIEDE